VDLPESQKPDKDETDEETLEVLRKPAPSCTALCRRYFGKGARIMRKHQVPVAMQPVKSLRGLLMHPNEKQEE